MSLPTTNTKHEENRSENNDARDSAGHEPNGSPTVGTTQQPGPDRGREFLHASPSLTQTHLTHVFRSRYLQLSRFDKLTDERIEALGRVLAGRPELEAAWRMLQHLYGIHLATDSEDANQALGAFINTYEAHPLLEFERLIGTLLEWGDEIFAFHETDRATNGRIEGTNNKIGVLKRIAYGFVNTTNFAARALLVETAR